jgi:signal transduction histidine kinase
LQSAWGAPRIAVASGFAPGRGRAVDSNQRARAAAKEGWNARCDPSMDEMARETRTDPAATPEPGRTRWWGLAIGVLGGAVDMAATLALGIRFEMNGADVTLLILFGYAITFAVLGYQFGLVVEARRRDRDSAAVIRAQMEAVAAVRARLAQAEKLAALGQLAAAIAHEARNALAVIRSSAQSVAEGLPAGADPSTRRASDFIVAEIDRLSNVITSLLSFARPPRLTPRPVAVSALFDQAEMLAAPELEAKRLRVVRRLADRVPLVRADSDLLVQVLLDLLSNAAAATPAGGEVALEARAVGDSVQIDVEDSGPGVPDELRARIFEPFFTTREKGTGLGLAIAKQIVEAHAGRIDVADRSGGGACFRISLPGAVAQAA